jgi:hypothetical protein
MAEQLEFPLGNVSLRQFDPVKNAAEGASRYTEGRYNPAGLENTMAKPRRGFAVGQAYKAAESQPEAPGIRDSYESMRQEVNRQHEFMTRPTEQGGMGLRHEVVAHDPYGGIGNQGDVGTAREMAADIGRGRIQTMSTATTGGHAYFSDEENDKFRAVHDVFGHAATGRGVSRNGEEAAYLSHRQMFPKQAQAALASETRGQNSYLNYGATQGDPEKRFPDQTSKLIGLPRFVQGK